MRPLLLSFTLPFLGEISFPAYFTMLTIGWSLAILITVRESRRLGLDPEEILDLNLYIVIWGVLGSRLLSVLADGHLQDYVNLCLDPVKVPATDALVPTCSTAQQCGYEYLCDTATARCHPPRDCFAWAKLWQGGLAYYGGLLAAIPLSFWYVRKRKMSMWRVADLASPAIILGLFFGRLGCYLNGCCYGITTNSIFGVRFPVGSVPWRPQYDAHLIRMGQPMQPVHPTQLYESLSCLAIFAVLYYVVRPRKRSDGQVFGAMLVMYAVARSLIEILRNDDRGVLFGWLSTSQIISVPLLALGIYTLVRRPTITPAMEDAAAKAAAKAAQVTVPQLAAARPGSDEAKPPSGERPKR